MTDAPDIAGAGGCGRSLAARRALGRTALVATMTRLASLSARARGHICLLTWARLQQLPSIANLNWRRAVVARISAGFQCAARLRGQHPYRAFACEHVKVVFSVDKASCGRLDRVRG